MQEKFNFNTKKTSNEGVFLNGKQQIVEMLRVMPFEEKGRLLKSISLRNSSLATELKEKSISYMALANLNDDDLVYTLNFIQPQIIGILLKVLKRSSQHRILSISNREYAEKAYKVFTTHLQNEDRDIERAKDKICDVLGKLYGRNQITIS